MAIEEGSIYQGKVTGTTKFGAFVELPEGKTGLVHISEIADSYVKEVSDHIRTGEEVTVKVLKLQEDGKIALSIRKAQENPASFEEKMNRFLQDSEDRLSALAKKTESRQSGRNRKS